MNEQHCPDCKLPLATMHDFDTIPSGEGQHLCWRQFTGDVCTGNPIDWQMRCHQAEAALEEVRGLIRQLIADCGSDKERAYLFERDIINRLLIIRATTYTNKIELKKPKE